MVYSIYYISIKFFFGRKNGTEDIVRCSWVPLIPFRPNFFFNNRKNDSFWIIIFMILKLFRYY